MNYNKIYDCLITRAKNRKLNGYTEKHHIIPRCLKGSDDPENLVELTAREHFIAHQLLVKMYPSEMKLACAAMLMCCGQEERKLTNRAYGWIREKFAEFMSICQSGEDNSQFGTMWVSNEEMKISRKVPKDFDVKYPWVKGKNTWNKTIRKEKREAEKAASKEKRELDRLPILKQTIMVYEELKSLRLVAKELNVSHIEVRNRIKKYEAITGESILKSQGK